MRKSELLLPVGSMDMCLAAIHGGADAIYVGMPNFNARGRSSNFSVEELKDMIQMCHLYGVKVHIAFNILIFEDEIKYAIEMLDEVIALGPDALIIQDLGLAKIVSDIYPDQVIHASTQMTVTNEHAIELVKDLNIKRFVLGRENSIEEIKKIRQATDKELEVFVHGALCVAYSGQCFTSESIGGRSANRGQCAQSCRFTYDLIVDGQKKDLIDRDYLVSPKDLCGINEIKTLMEIGVDSFKVEGRLKGPIFAGTAAKAYKSTMLSGVVNSSDVQKMATTYSRGFFSGWLHGVDHQLLVDGKFQDHRGLFLGKVKSVKGKNISFKTDVEIKNGMGVVICNDQNKSEIGSSIFESYKSGSDQVISLNKEINSSKIEIGDDIYLSSNPEVNKEIEKSVSDLNKQKRIPLHLKLTAQVGELLMLEAWDNDDHYVMVESENILEAAKSDYDIKVLENELDSLSRTIYARESIEVEIQGPKPFIHNKALKNLKNKAVEELNAKRIEVKSLDRYEVKNQNIDSISNSKTLNIVLRNIEQVKSLNPYFLSLNIQNEIAINIILDFEFGKHYHDALKELEDLRSSKKIQVAIATNRILKPGEYHHLNMIARLNLDFILVRNLGAINYLQANFPQIKLKGDFSLNVANSFAANYLLSKGLQTLTSSYDLNANQLFELLKNTQASRIEVTTHQYMPSFHMEHCVFAAFLSKGSSFKDCGKPCEKHKVELRDQFGNHHFIKADQECRNTMFNATAQSAASLLPKLLELGVREFRIEMLDEMEDTLIKKVSSYIDFLQSNISIETLTSNIGELEKFGLGSGQLLKNERKNMVSLHHSDS